MILRAQFCELSSLALVLTFGLFQPLGAQTADRSFDESGRRLHPGDTIFVTTREGNETRGTLVRLTSTSLVISVGRGEREILAVHIQSIEKRGDPLWNGALIGAGLFGVIAALPAAIVGCDGCRGGVAGVVLEGVAIGAAFGMLVDWLHQGRTPIYRAPPATVRVLPVLDPGRRGVMLSIQF